MDASNMTGSARNTLLATSVRVVLLVLILGQIVFLAGRWRVRADLTGDKLFTLTDTSLQMIDALDDRLLIECYFSVESRLPAYYRPSRRTLTNFLAEYEKLGKGKIVVQYFDPQDDNLVREKALRLGMAPQNAADASEASYSVLEVWQGVRLLYGADKQKVIPFLLPQTVTFAYEAILVPLIRELTVVDKPRIALWAYETELDVSAMYDHLRHHKQTQRTPPPRHGFKRLAEVVGGRYSIEPIALENGQLVPEHYEQLLLVRPKRLTDWQKYALDQFLMRGGKLVAFMDTAEVHIGPLRTMAIEWIRYDADDSQHRLVDQFAHYGVKIDEKLVADCLNEMSVHFSIPVQTQMGQGLQNFAYPYWLHARNVDYSQFAETLAGITPGADQEMLRHFRSTFRRGIAAESDLFSGFQEFQAGPTLFWPCGVDLADPLPEGVSGEVLMRTSPLSFSEFRTGNLHPVGQHADPRQWKAAYEAFINGIQQKVQSEPRRQIGLMVSLSGPFPSFFGGRPPGAKGAESPPKEPDKDPLEEPVGTPPEVAGPPVPDGSKAAAEIRAGGLAKAAASARLVVLADSDFIRDDLLAGEHQQKGGPYSAMSAPFFRNLMDWLAMDRELLGLRNKQPDLGVLSFGARSLTQEADEAEFARAMQQREKWIQMINICFPGALMLLLWLVVSLRRRARKEAFLASVADN